MNEPDYKYLFKFILIGNSGVGKTCIMRRFADEIYEDNQSSTIGVDFKIKTLTLEEFTIKLQIWDTAGQERFRAIISNYYRGADGILVVFDLTNKESFDNLSEWIREVSKNTQKNVEIIVLGNKLDKSDEIVVSDDEINLFLKENEINKDNFLKVSAKDDIKINFAFEVLARNLSKKIESGEFVNIKKDNTKLRMGDVDGGKCCM